MKKANETMNKATRKPEQLSYSYYLPDLLYCTQKTYFPSLDELVFLGKENLQGLLCNCRTEERKLRNYVKLLTITLRTWIKVDSESIQAFYSANDTNFVLKGGQRPCNWCSGSITAMETLKSCELNAEGEDEDQHWWDTLSRVHSCRFGNEIAEWCPMNPIGRHCATRDCKKCGSKEVCTLSKSPYPFLDQPCILCSGDEQILRQIRNRLAEKLSVATRSRDLVQMYVSRITVAKERAESKPTMPLFREDKYFAAGDIVLIAHEIPCPNEDDYNFDWQAGTVIMANSSKDDFQSIRVRAVKNNSCIKASHFDYTLLSIKDAKYLVENPDFANVWLSAPPCIDSESLRENYCKSLKEYLAEK